jgi:PAS domain S-box-containing protein
MSENQPDSPHNVLVEQKEFAGEVIEALGQGVTIVDANGRFIYANPAYTHLVGLLPDDVIGKTPYDFTYPEDWPKLRQAWQQRLSDQTTTYETRLLRADGSLIYTHVTGVPYRQEDKFVGSITIIADVTAQKQAEEAYRTLVEHSLQGLLIIQDFRVVFANKRVEQISGYTLAELQAWSPETIMDHVHPEDREAVAARLQAHLAGEPAPAQMLFRIYHKDGRIRWVEVHTSHITYQGKPAAQVAYLDITERQEAEARLLQEKQFSEAIIDSLPDIFYVFDDRGKMVRWNKNVEVVSGYTGAEIARMQPLEFIAEADRSRITVKIEEAFTQGEATDEANFLAKDGRQRLYLFTGRRFLVGDRPHLVGVGLDISDRKAAEEALRASEERYRSLVNSVGDIIFQTDAAGRWTFLNNAWAEITGFSLADSLGQSCLQKVNLDDREKYATELQSLLAGEKDFCRRQVRHLTQNSGYRWLEVHARRVEDSAGNPQGISGLLRDVTERKQHEQELGSMVAVTQALRWANTRQQILPIILDQLLDLLQAGGAMFVIHPRPERKLIELARGAWQALSGQPLPSETLLADFTADTGELYTNPDVRRSLPVQYAGLLQPHFALIGAPVVSSRQVTGVLWVGRPQPFSTTEGRSLQAIAGLTAAALDRAQLLATLEERVRERTQSLILANERLQELDRLKTKLIDDISHELRTPAANITLYLDLLARSRPEKWTGHLQALRENSRRLNEIIDGILQFTHLAETIAAHTFTAIDLNQVTASAIADCRLQAVTLDLAWMPADDLPLVSGTAGLVAQMIAYLLDNAVKYTAGKGPDGLVEISTHLDRDRQMAGVQIRDTGIGIEADELNLVFDRFYRGRQVSQLTTPGAGLGLSLAQQIAAQLGGRIDVESQVNVGTTVTLWLPLAQGEA